MARASFIMRYIIHSLVLLLIALPMNGSASLAMYEAGKAVICIDEDIEKSDLLSAMDVYPAIYFEPITSREEVKDNYYRLLINKITIMTSMDLATMDKPTSITISDKPLVGEDIFVFDIVPKKNVSIGKLGLVNTTMYSGDWMDQTPHFVIFSGNGFYCCIYNQDISEKSFLDLIGRVDILNKSELASKLSHLWSEEAI